MQRPCFFEAHHSPFLDFKVIVLQMRIVYQVQPVRTHIVREKKYRHEYPRLYMTEGTAKLHHGLIGGDLFRRVIEKRTHIISVCNHFIQHQGHSEH